MEHIEFKGNNGFIKFHFIEFPGFPNETHFTGGYECLVKTEIKSGIFSGSCQIWSSTGDFINLFKDLEKSYNKIDGISKYTNYEHNLNFEIKFDKFGHVVISGMFYEYSEDENSLNFEIQSDQSFIKAAIIEFKLLENKYGGMTGIIDTKV